VPEAADEEERLPRLHSMFAAIALSAAVAGMIPAQNEASEASVEFKIMAQRYTFAPNEIKIQRGTRVRLVITALDGEHGFKLPAFRIEQKLSKGEAVTVEFTADRAGRFPYQCSHVCGLGHRRMKGLLIVE
jgi:cytochrome c oxidase subunit II